jgi:hypothetical protein
LISFLLLLCLCVFSALVVDTLRQKIDVLAADVGRGGRPGKKELWQLSDESEVSAASADDDAGEDEDQDDDGSTDSDSGGAVVRKPRPAKLIAVSSNDAERRQQRQVTRELRCRGAFLTRLAPAG